MTISSANLPGFIHANWPAPSGVMAGTTLRDGGTSNPPYDSFNLAEHVGDELADVTRNRQQLIDSVGLPNQPVWLNQVHGKQIVELNTPMQKLIDADGAFTSEKTVVCAVLTADCLPILLCDKTGSQVAAIHAGWRGITAGIIEAALALFTNMSNVMVWLGPAIGPQAYEVGEEMRQVFVEQDQDSAAAFTAMENDKWLANLYTLAKLRLQAMGVSAIYGGGYCTYSDEAKFFSYRRDGLTGRMASLIWIQDNA